MTSLIERYEFLARTSQDPVDAQGFRDAVEALKMCQRALEFYSCNCAVPCTETAYKETLCGLRANRTLKAMADGRTNH
jgi:hypothetical protein